MTERDNYVKTYLSDSEYSQLKEWADETGKSMSHLLREAVMEYTDHDRTARIEEKLDRVLDTLSEQDAHTHKNEIGMNRASESLETARSMIRRIQQNHDEVIKDADVVRVVEDMAGIDDRTIRKYKDIFRRRGLLFEHPGKNPVWTVNAETWLSWVEDYAQLNGVEEAEMAIESYPARVTETLDGKIGIQLEEETEQ